MHCLGIKEGHDFAITQHAGYCNKLVIAWEPHYVVLIVAINFICYYVLVITRARVPHGRLRPSCFTELLCQYLLCGMREARVANN